MSRIKVRTAKNYIAPWPACLLLLLVLSSAFIFLSLFSWPETISGLGILLLKGEIGQVVSTQDGTVEQWLVEESDAVRAGQAVLLIRPHDQPLRTLPIISPSAGNIAEILAYPGTSVHIGEGLALLTAAGEAKKDLELIGFVSSRSGKRLRTGMKARIYPSVSDVHLHGALIASVKKIGKLPTAKAALKSLVKIPELAKYLRRSIEDEPFLVVLSLEPSEEHRTGYKWNGPGPDFALDYGIIADFSIIYAEPSVLERLWPSLHHLLLDRS